MPSRAKTQKIDQKILYLKIKIQNIWDIDIWWWRWETIVFPKEVGQSKISVSCVPFRQKDGVIESQIFTTSHFLEKTEN